jgi:hypothetical protein
MSEATDIVVPIRQRLQADISDIKRNVAELKTRADSVDMRLAAVESYITCTIVCLFRTESTSKRRPTKWWNGACWHWNARAPADSCSE